MLSNREQWIGYIFCIVICLNSLYTSVVGRGIVREIPVKNGTWMEEKLLSPDHFPITQMPNADSFKEFLRRFKKSGLSDKTVRWFYDTFYIDLDEIKFIDDGSNNRSGTFGVVRRATYKNIFVISKELKKGIDTKPGSFKSMEREAFVNALVRNIPGVPLLYGFRSDTEPNVMVTEMVADADNDFSTSIVKRLKADRHNLSPWDVVDVCLRVIRILINIHKAGVIHRDLKRSNVLIQKRADGSLHPYIIDFNLGTFEKEFEARNVPVKKALNFIKNHYQYAPELWLEHQTESPNSDAYSIGKVFEYVADATHNQVIGDVADMITAYYTKRLSLPYVEYYLQNAIHMKKYRHLHDV